MYLAHFGLREAPFGLTPDTSFAFASERYRSVLETLRVAVGTGEGFIKITGEVGTGKTLACRSFMKSLDERFVLAYLPNPMLSPRALVRAVALELEAMAITAPDDEYFVNRAVSLRLLGIARQGKRALLCIDEAQAMPLETLEALRLLTNLETEKQKLLQIVLFGQPELDRKLQNPNIRQLAQRITFQDSLHALDRDEVGHYLAHRLAVAGHASGPLFVPAAVRVLHHASGGIPRLINILAHKALLAAYGEGARQVRVRHLRRAVTDTPAARPLPRWRVLLPAAALCGLAATGAVVGRLQGWLA